jgi:hypothetical protein
MQKVIWSSASASKGKAPRRLALHNNGLLALYDANNVKLWETERQQTLWTSGMGSS